MILPENTDLKVSIYKQHGLDQHQQRQNHSGVNTIPKMADIVSNLHMSLLKARNFKDNYRDLSEEEEELLEATKSNAEANCLFAGILAIDSCVNSLIQSETKIQQELSKAFPALVNEFQNIQNICEHINHSQITACINNFRDILTFILHLISQLSFIEKRQLQVADKLLRRDICAQKHTQQKRQQNEQYKNLISELSQQNSRLRQQISSLITQKSSGDSIPTEKIKRSEIMDKKQGKSWGNIQKWRKQQQKKSNYKSEEIDCLELDYKKLQKQNNLLKQYQDIDNIILLEKLERQVQKLHQQRIKDQKIIHDIHKKMESMSSRQPVHKYSNHPQQYYPEDDLRQSDYQPLQRDKPRYYQQMQIIRNQNQRYPRRKYIKQQILYPEEMEPNICWQQTYPQRYNEYIIKGRYNQLLTERDIDYQRNQQLTDDVLRSNHRRRNKKNNYQQPHQRTATAQQMYAHYHPNYQQFEDDDNSAVIGSSHQRFYQHNQHKNTHFQPEKYHEQQKFRGQAKSYGKREQNQISPRNTIKQWRKTHRTPTRSSLEPVEPQNLHLHGRKVIPERERPTYRHARSPTILNENNFEPQRKKRSPSYFQKQRDQK